MFRCFWTLAQTLILTLTQNFKYWPQNSELWNYIPSSFYCLRSKRSWRRILPKYSFSVKSDIFNPYFVSITQDQAVGMRRGDVLLHHNGLVTLKYSKIIQSSCKTNVAHYPFDKQECMFKFGSWTFNGFDIAIDSKDEVFINYPIKLIVIEQKKICRNNRNAIPQRHPAFYIHWLSGVWFSGRGFVKLHEERRMGNCWIFNRTT